MTIDESKSSLLLPNEVAELLRVKVQTLALWRSTGRGGLPFIRLGNKAIRYRESDVQVFLTQNTATSTAAMDALNN
jgi:predicted site-specific integrase-resolvase